MSTSELIHVPGASKAGDTTLAPSPGAHDVSAEITRFPPKVTSSPGIMRSLKVSLLRLRSAPAAMPDTGCGGGKGITDVPPLDRRPPPSPKNTLWKSEGSMRGCEADGSACSTMHHPAKTKMFPSSSCTVKCAALSEFGHGILYLEILTIFCNVSWNSSPSLSNHIFAA